MTPFDFINSINNKEKKDLIRSSDNPELAEKLYKPFVINKGFSYFIDTIMYANELNAISHVDNKLQNDFYLNTIRPGKRFSKWYKRGDDSTIESIQEYFKVNYVRAQEIAKILTEEQIDLIKTKITKGNTHELRPKHISGGKT